MDTYKEDIYKIIEYSLKEVLPDKAVVKALEGRDFSHGRIIAVAIGKAAYRMAYVLSRHIRVDKGIVITKYGHLKEALENFELYEAGHPLLDDNTIKATKRVLEITSDLKEDDQIIFLVSGGGSALFEDPLISLEELIGINDQLLKCGADIKEINTVRKHLSKVKGGRFAKHCAPAKVYQIVLSDVLGNRIDAIASGPSAADTSTSRDAFDIIRKYDLHLSDEALKMIEKETPKETDNVETFIGASVIDLCEAAKTCAQSLGYETLILDTQKEGFARDAGKELAEEAIKRLNNKEKTCLIMGGETVVKIKGKGLGGRNQECALSAAEYIKNKNIAIVSIGSDGTDGPTDAAGGYVDGDTYDKLKELGIDIDAVLEDNDSYHALKRIDQLIFTGPTGTNINDLMIALLSK